MYSQHKVSARARTREMLFSPYSKRGREKAFATTPKKAKLPPMVVSSVTQSSVAFPKNEEPDAGACEESPPWKAHQEPNAGARKKPRWFKAHQEWCWEKFMIHAEFSESGGFGSDHFTEERDRPLVLCEVEHRKLLGIIAEEQLALLDTIPGI